MDGVLFYVCCAVVGALFGYVFFRISVWRGECE